MEENKTQKEKALIENFVNETIVQFSLLKETTTCYEKQSFLYGMIPIIRFALELLRSDDAEQLARMKEHYEKMITEIALKGSTPPIL